MILENVQSYSRPQLVVVENLPDGPQRIIISKDISEIQDEEGIRYQYKEAVFNAPDDRILTVDEVEEQVDAWWIYAGEEHNQPTLAERVDMLEEAVDMLIGGGDE